jgi:hypothetical protein
MPSFGSTLQDDIWSKENVTRELEQGPKPERLRLDTWTGAQLKRHDLDLGLGLTKKIDQWRPTLQLAQDKVGLGLGYQIKSSKTLVLLDFTVGLNYVWDVTDGSRRFGIYASIFKF